MTTKVKQKPAAAGSPPARNGFSIISKQKLLALYTAMVRCRMLAERAQELFKQKSAANRFAASVHEATAAGFVIDMRPGDSLSPLPGDPTPCLVKGLPAGTILSELRTAERIKITAGTGAQAKSQLQPQLQPSSISAAFEKYGIIPDPAPQAARLRLVSGIALARKTVKGNPIAVAFCTGTVASAQSSRDAFRFAVAHELPILFVFHHTKSAAQVLVEDAFPRIAEECAIPCMTVDGNDAVAVYRVMHESINHARRGKGPTLIECRIDAESGDPIENMELYLTRKGIISEPVKRKAIAAFKQELTAASSSARKRRGV